MNQLKLWEKDRKGWKKVEGWLDKIENLLLEIEADGEKIASQSSDLPNLSSAQITEENQPEQTENFISEENPDITLEEDPFEEDWDAYAMSDD